MGEGTRKATHEVRRIAVQPFIFFSLLYKVAREMPKAFAAFDLFPLYRWIVAKSSCCSKEDDENWARLIAGILKCLESLSLNADACAGSRISPVHWFMALSIIFCSSRTLPGQEYSCKNSIKRGSTCWIYKMSTKSFAVGR